MIKHIVFFKLKNLKDDLLRARQALESLRKIDFIQHLEVGVDIDRSARAFDLALVTSFSSLEDLHKYAKHPDHQPVIELMREICEKVHVVDYEV